MQEVIIKAKAKYLKETYPFSDVPKLSDRKHCIHCDQDIIVGDFKVFKDKSGQELIYCPNAPECDGTPLDWFSVPDE